MQLVWSLFRFLSSKESTPSRVTVGLLSPRSAHALAQARPHNVLHSTSFIFVRPVLGTRARAIAISNQRSARRRQAVIITLLHNCRA